MASGVVESVSSKVISNGKTKWNLKVAGVNYGCFQNPGDVAVGDEITFDVEQKDQWFNAKNVRKGGLLPNGAMTSSYPNNVTPMPNSGSTSNGGHTTSNSGRPMDPEREARIVRQNATSSAATIIAAIIAVQPDAGWTPEKALQATFEASKDIFRVNFEGYESGF